MPLRCIDEARQPYLAWKMSREQWTDLRDKNRLAKHLKMPCCGAGVVLRVSKLGTKHFAHSRRGECTSAPETPEHLLAKMAIAEAVEKTGWIAETEYRGQLVSVV